MAYFPFMVDIENYFCLVAGGGRIALHKVKILLGFGAHIRVVAAEPCRELKELSRRELSVQITNRDFRDSDIDGVDMVVAATDDEALNYHISDLCKKKKIPVNAVDMKEACSFIFPAIIQDKDLLIAVSTGGRSPAAAAYVKRQIGSRLPAYYGDMIEALGKYRELVLRHVDTAAGRKEVFNALLAYGDAHDGRIPEEKVRELIEEFNPAGD